MRKKTVSQLKKEAWKVFSKYIRTRDNFTCFTCGRKGNQAGHMISKHIGGSALYFHPENVHCQCYFCNINLGGNGSVYSKRFIDEYSLETFNKLHTLKDAGNIPWTSERLQNIKDTYQKKLEEFET